jgi:hypothetical protein
MALSGEDGRNQIASSRRSHVEPVSDDGARNGISRECEKPPFRRNNCEDADGSLSPETAWWAHRARTWDR